MARQPLWEPSSNASAVSLSPLSLLSEHIIHCIPKPPEHGANIRTMWPKTELAFTSKANRVKYQKAREPFAAQPYGDFGVVDVHVIVDPAVDEFAEHLVLRRCNKEQTPADAAAFTGGVLLDDS